MTPDGPSETGTSKGAARRQSGDRAADVVSALGRSSSPSCTSPARRAAFVLHGNTYDYVRIGDGDAARYGTLAEFLAEQLFGRWSLVLHYDLGSGLRVLAGRDEKRLQDMVDARQSQGRRHLGAAEGSGRDVRAGRSLRPRRRSWPRRPIG